MVKNVKNENLFFISNYCYTEIDKIHNKNYSEILLPKTKSGFLVWQNGGNKGAYPVNEAEKIIKKNIKCNGRKTSNRCWISYL